MSTAYSVITEEFCDDLNTIRSLVNAFADSHTRSPKERIAAANSATLLLAATFEEFVREMARSYARAVVAATESFEKLPKKLASRAWQRTLEKLARVRVSTDNFSAEIMTDARTRFDVVFEFCKGDLTQDIYRDLVHNPNNMRPDEINALFNVSALPDVCGQSARKKPLLDNLGEVDPNRARARFVAFLEEFFERRNEIAHSLSPAQSSGPDQIILDVELFEAFGKALCQTLEAISPDRAPPAPQESEPRAEL